MYNLVWWLFAYLLQVFKWAKKKEIISVKTIGHVIPVNVIHRTGKLRIWKAGRRLWVVTSALKSLRRDTVVQQLSCVRLPDWWKNIHAVQTNTSKIVLIIILFRLDNYFVTHNFQRKLNGNLIFIPFNNYTFFTSEINYLSSSVLLVQKTV